MWETQPAVVSWKASALTASVCLPHLFHLDHLGRQLCNTEYSGSEGLSLPPTLSLVRHGDVGVEREGQKGQERKFLNIEI